MLVCVCKRGAAVVNTQLLLLFVSRLIIALAWLAGDRRRQVLCQCRLSILDTRTHALQWNAQLLPAGRTIECVCVCGLLVLVRARIHARAHDLLKKNN